MGNDLPRSRRRTLKGIDREGYSVKHGPSVASSLGLLHLCSSEQNVYSESSLEEIEAIIENEIVKSIDALRGLLFTEIPALALPGPRMPGFAESVASRLDVTAIRLTLLRASSSLVGYGLPAHAVS